MQPNFLGQKIREIREKSLGSIVSASKILGVDKNTLGVYERGPTLPDVDFLINFCEETDAHFSELLELRIKSSPMLPNDVEKASAYLIDRAAYNLNMVDKFSQMRDAHLLKQDQQNYNDSLYIAHYPEVKAAAGVGKVTETDQIAVMVAVNASEWRARVGLNPKNIKVITVYGDSMNPTLCHGDQVMIDFACQSFIDDAIYALQQGDLIRIKRVKLNLDGSILVKSDNENGFIPERYSKDEAASFVILGKVLPFKFGQFKI